MSLSSKYFALDTRDRLFLPYAWCLLGFYRLAVLCLPLKYLTRAMARSPRTAPGVATAGASLQRAVAIGWLIGVAARFTPWRSNCLVQALAVQRELARRGIGGRICIGVRRQPGRGGLAAHAWLQCAGEVVCGEPERAGYIPISAFAWGGPPAPAD